MNVIKKEQQQTTIVKNVLQVIILFIIKKVNVFFHVKLQMILIMIKIKIHLKNVIILAEHVMEKEQLKTIIVKIVKKLMEYIHIISLNQNIINVSQKVKNQKIHI
jgi:hypothetical protein